MADGEGVLHAPFATGRAFLSELGRGVRDGMRILFHSEVGGRLEVEERSLEELCPGLPEFETKDLT